MVRLAELLALACCLCAQTPVDDLTQAAKDPYSLARYIESHSDFDWSELWPALGTPAPAWLPQSCHFQTQDEKCPTELVGIVIPDQTILLIRDNVMIDVYLRYLGRPGSWRFAGLQSFYIRDHPRRHEILRSNGLPILRVSMQGVYGSGINSELEQWFDLNKAHFEPIFEYTVTGFKSGYCLAIEHSIHSDAWLLEGAIEVHLQTDLSLGGHPLGTLMWTGTYARAPGAKSYELVSVKSDMKGQEPIPGSDFESFSNIGGEHPNAPERLLHYAMPELRKLAANKEARTCMQGLVQSSKDTPDARELKKLLR